MPQLEENKLLFFMFFEDFRIALLEVEHNTVISLGFLNI